MPASGQSSKLAQDPFLRRIRDEPGVPADEFLRLGNEAEVERQLAFEPWAAQQPQGVVAKDRLADSA